MQTGAERLKQLLGARVFVNVTESRFFAGIMIGYDKHLNVVLKESTEFRIIDNEWRQEPRGLIVLRGVNVETIGTESTPLPIMRGYSHWQIGNGRAQPLV